MNSQSGRGPELRATLYEIESGLFQAIYHIHRSGSNVHELPACQVASCASIAKERIEQSARALGYETVIWEERHKVPPVFLRPPKARTVAPRD